MINFTRLFTTLGRLVGGLNETNTWRGTITSRYNTLRTQFSSSSVYDRFISSIVNNRSAGWAAQDAHISNLADYVVDAITEEVLADATLFDRSFAACLAELVRQMNDAGESLNRCTGNVNITPVSTPIGDPVFITSDREYTGRRSDFFIPDTIQIRCAQDRSLGAPAYSEIFTLRGNPADARPTSHLYPSGSGVNAQISLTNPATFGGVVQNHNFDSFTGNTPFAWTLPSGVTAGVHVFRQTNDDPRGTGAENNSLRFLGDGTVIPRVVQRVTLPPERVFVTHFRLKNIANPAADWAVSIRLVDSAGNQVNGPAGFVNRHTSAAATSVTSNWQNVVTGVFITPKVLPTGGLFLELRLHDNTSVSTAPVNGASACVDHVILTEAAYLYPGGPIFHAFSGLNECERGDSWSMTVALDSGSPSSYLIRGIDRLLNGGLAAAPVRIPTSATPTQPDSLIT